MCDKYKNLQMNYSISNIKSIGYIPNNKKYPNQVGMCFEIDYFIGNI